MSAFISAISYYLPEAIVSNQDLVEEFPEWSVDKIAKKISNDGVSFTKEDIYKDAIYQVGTFQPMIVEEKAYEDFKRIWEKQGLGFLIKEAGRKDSQDR